jgi:hypothetical protein
LGAVVPNLQELESESRVLPSRGPQLPRKPFFLESRRGRIAAASVLALFGLCIGLYGLLYEKFAGLVDRRLAAGAFSHTFNIFTAPKIVAVGDPLTLDAVVGRLRRSGYSTAQGNSVGWYRVQPGAVSIFPGRNSFSGGEPGVLEFERGKISRIVSLQDNFSRRQTLFSAFRVRCVADSQSRVRGSKRRP